MFPVDHSTSTTLSTQYYIGAYEKETDAAGNITETHYIPGGDGLLALYLIENGVGTMYYAHKDHLGSLYALTDENGNVATYNGQQQRFSFDPCSMKLDFCERSETKAIVELIPKSEVVREGRRRNPINWTFTGVPDANNYLIDRGFTGHQHLDVFGLVNMNGRMYDPLLGRMLSPDNYVQSPFSSQGFNRYSYVMNNPLVYSDPSGELIFIIPSFAWSPQGGLDISVTVGVGIPGVLSVQATVGHGFKSNNSYVTLGATVVGLTGSIGYGTQTGITAGLNYGLTSMIPNGFGTNLTSVGLNYSQNGGFTTNAFGYSYGREGLSFNPSISYRKTFLIDKPKPIVPNLPSDNLLASLDNNLILGSEGLKNVPGGDWDFWGEGYVPYEGDAIGGTNFIGPGPNADPYSLPDPNSDGYLQPVDRIDGAAQKHDYSYWKANTGGVWGALFNRKVAFADALLVIRANRIMNQYREGNTSISPRTYNLSRAVYYLFYPITLNKFKP